MDALTRVAQQAEKPGRLQLAIAEWQRQLIAQREARLIGRWNDPDHGQFGESWNV
jgi:hypothetical protein